MDMTRGTHRERIFAANSLVMDAATHVHTGADWQQFITTADSFRHYSADNQLLLTAQGASGGVASAQAWATIPATNGGVCSVRSGEQPVGIYAPIYANQREVDPATGLPTRDAIVGHRIIPVFHQGQLVDPPALPGRRHVLMPAHDDIWEAIADQLYAGGFTVRLDHIASTPGVTGLTRFVERSVLIDERLPLAEAIRAEVHQLAHTRLHTSIPRDPGLHRNLVEIEADSVAYLVCNTLGVDTGRQDFPNATEWAGRDPARVASTAGQVLRTARTIVADLETNLAVNLTPNPIVDYLTVRPELLKDPSGQAWLIAPGTVDATIAEHVSAGGFTWARLGDC